MSRGHNLRGPYDLQSVTSDAFVYCVQFETNNASTPDGVVQDDDGVTIARADTGDFTVTFPSGNRPQALLFGAGTYIEDEANLFVKVTGYTASTGVLTVTSYTNAAGTIAAADTTDKTLALFCVFCRKSANS
jgi:hypothetical protein